jgi:hypothetical protein
MRCAEGFRRHATNLNRGLREAQMCFRRCGSHAAMAEDHGPRRRPCVSAPDHRQGTPERRPNRPRLFLVVLANRLMAPVKPQAIQPLAPLGGAEILMTSSPRPWTGKTPKTLPVAAAMLTSTRCPGKARKDATSGYRHDPRIVGAMAGHVVLRKRAGRSPAPRLLHIDGPEPTDKPPFGGVGIIEVMDRARRPCRSRPFRRKLSGRRSGWRAATPHSEDAAIPARQGQRRGHQARQRVPERPSRGRAH